MDKQSERVLNPAHTGRALLGATACVLALAGPVRHGEASFVGCRADPILHLSNGAALRVAATIGADRRAIGRITYTVRVPRGLRLLKTTYTGGPLGTHETVYFSADNAPDTFSTDTLVNTPGVRAAVTASIAVQGGRGTATGYSGDHLLVTLHRPAPDTTASAPPGATASPAATSVETAVGPTSTATQGTALATPTAQPTATDNHPHGHVHKSGT